MELIFVAMNTSSRLTNGFISPYLSSSTTLRRMRSADLEPTRSYSKAMTPMTARLLSLMEIKALQVEKIQRKLKAKLDVLKLKLLVNQINLTSPAIIAVMIEEAPTSLLERMMRVI